MFIAPTHRVKLTSTQKKVFDDCLSGQVNYHCENIFFGYLFSHILLCRILVLHTSKTSQEDVNIISVQLYPKQAKNLSGTDVQFNLLILEKTLNLLAVMLSQWYFFTTTRKPPFHFHGALLFNTSQTVAFC